MYGNPAPKQILDLKAIGAVCNDLLHNSKSTLLKQEVWVLLACVVSNDEEFDMCVDVLYENFFRRLTVICQNTVIDISTTRITDFQHGHKGVSDPILRCSATPKLLDRPPAIFRNSS